IFQSGFLHLHIGTLEVGIDAKERVAHFDPVPLSNWQGLDPAGFVRSDEDEIGLDPALESRWLAVITARQRKYNDDHTCQGESECYRSAADHGVSPPPKRRSRCARISARTSSGRKRANSPSQTRATRAGAINSCGNRASASLLSSPPSTARV